MGFLIDFQYLHIEKKAREPLLGRRLADPTVLETLGANFRSRGGAVRPRYPPV